VATSTSAPPDVAVGPDTTVPTVATVTTVTTVATVPTTIAPEPTGVPGLGATDPFCAAWAAYASTLQALGVAGAFGALTVDQLAVLELRAAPRLVEAAAAINASWPAELAAEHDLVIEHRVGPFARRAQKAIDALVDAGATPADLATLSATWEQALSTRTQADSVVDPAAVDAALETRLETAAAAFGAAVTPFASDPSLVVDSVETPLTDAYLAAHCPDVASSGVGDAL